MDSNETNADHPKDSSLQEEQSSLQKQLIENPTQNDFSILKEQEAELHLQESYQKIMAIVTAFMTSQVLFTANELGLFTYLDSNPCSSSEKIQEVYGLNGRGVSDFLDTLVSLDLLEKTQTGYINSAHSQTFLVQNKSSYIGDLIKLGKRKSYQDWANFQEILKTGKPMHVNNEKLYDLYKDEHRARLFLNGMHGNQANNFILLLNKFPIKNYKTVVDIGGALGGLSALIATQNSHINCITWDLPHVKPYTVEYITKLGLQDQVQVAVGDFQTDDFPAADVVFMGNILHNWGKETQQMLVAKAFKALSSNGVFIAIERVFDEKKQNRAVLLASLNMLVQTFEGFEYTEEEFTSLVKGAGFKKTQFIPLFDSYQANIAFK